MKKINDAGFRAEASRNDTLLSFCQLFTVSFLLSYHVSFLHSYQRRFCSANVPKNSVKPMVEK